MNDRDFVICDSENAELSEREDKSQKEKGEAKQIGSQVSRQIGRSNSKDNNEPKPISKMKKRENQSKETEDK